MLPETVKVSEPRRVQPKGQIVSPNVSCMKTAALSWVGGWIAMTVPSLKGLPKRSRDADAERMAEARVSVVEVVMVQEWPVSMEVLLGSS